MRWYAAYMVFIVGNMVNDILFSLIAMVFAGVNCDEIAIIQVFQKRRIARRARWIDDIKSWAMVEESNRKWMSG